MYPSPGRPLLPQLFVPYIGKQELSPPVAMSTGLPSSTTLADLDAGLWESLQPQVIDELVGDVVQAAARVFVRLDADLVLYRERPTVDEARLTVRTVNVLRREGVIEDGRLRPVSLGTIRRFVNFGVRSFLDLLSEYPTVGTEVQRDRSRAEPAAAVPAVSEAVVAAARGLSDEKWCRQVTANDPRFGPLVRAIDPAAADAWEAAHTCAGRRHHGDDVSTAVESITSLHSQCAEACEETLQTELRQIIESTGQSENASKMLRHRLGFGGKPPVTLEKAAKKVGLTRERVRQVEAKFRARLRDHASVWTPVLDRAIGEVAGWVPVDVGEVATRLVAEGMASKPFSIESLMSAAEVFGRDVPWEVADGLVLRSGTVDMRKPVVSAAQKLASKWGAVSVRSLRDALPGDERTKLKVLRSVLEQIPDVTWLDEDREWFALPVARSRLYNNVTKIMSIGRSVALPILCEGAVRNERMRGFAAPHEVVGAWCEWTGDYTPTDGDVVAHESVPDWREVLDGIEFTLAEVLSTYGPVMSRKDLEYECVEVAGLKKSSFDLYLSFSPIIEMVGPARYALRGLGERKPGIDGSVPSV